MTRSNIKKQLAVAAVVGAIAIVIAWTWGMSSDAYEIAKTYATSAPETISRFGIVTKASVCSFKTQSNGARYSFSVEGDKSSGTLIAFLKKNPRWRVDHAQAGE